MRHSAKLRTTGRRTTTPSWTGSTQIKEKGWLDEFAAEDATFDDLFENSVKPSVEKLIAAHAAIAAAQSAGDQEALMAAIDDLIKIDADIKATDGEIDEHLAIMTARCEDLVKSLQAETDGAATAATKASEDVVRTAAIVAGAALIIALIFGVVVTRMITGSLGLMVARVRDIASGEGDLTLRVDLDSRDELGALAGWMNTFIEKLQGLIRGVSDATDAVGSASEQVAASAGEAASGATEISNAMDRLAHAAGEQTERFKDINGEMTALVDAIGQVSSGAESQVVTAMSTMEVVQTMADASHRVAALAAQVAEAASTSSETAREGAAAVSNGVAAMGRIQQHAAQSMGLIENLGKRSEAIGEIVGVIEDVAEQTNLLALNAAIEAARAGEHGKGFAVVADEVRKLAERAASSTGQITSLVKEIQSLITEAVKAQAEGTRATEEGASVINQAGAALSDILQSVEQVVELMATVQSASGEMADGVEQVVKAMDDMSAVTEENSAASELMAATSAEVRQGINGVANLVTESAASTEEASASCEEQSAAAEEIAASAEELSASAAMLQSIVGQFKF